MGNSTSKHKKHRKNYLHAVRPKTKRDLRELLSWEEGSASDLLENPLKLLELEVELLKLGSHQGCLSLGDVIVHLDN